MRNNRYLNIEYRHPVALPPLPFAHSWLFILFFIMLNLQQSFISSAPLSLPRANLHPRQRWKPSVGYILRLITRSWGKQSARRKEENGFSPLHFSHFGFIFRLFISSVSESDENNNKTDSPSPQQPWYEGDDRSSLKSILSTVAGGKRRTKTWKWKQ